MMKKILLFAITLIVFLNFANSNVTITGFTTSGPAMASLTVLVPRPFCNLDLVNKWNFVSICAEPDNITVENMTDDFSDKFEYILKWNASSQAYEVYSIYAIDKPFADLDINESYFLYMTDSAEWNIPGLKRNDTNVSLLNLWNAPTYPYELTGNVSRYLETVDGRYEYMLKWDEPTQSYSLWSVYAVDKPFNQIFKGEGQFIYVNDTTALLQYNRTYVTS